MNKVEFVPPKGNTPQQRYQARGYSKRPDVKAKVRERCRRYRAEGKYKNQPRQVAESLLRKRVRAFMLLGGKCVMCGNGDLRVLQLDHVNGGGLAERGRGRANNMQWVFEQPERFQILCANCHCIKHFQLRMEDLANTQEAPGGNG